MGSSRRHHVVDLGLIHCTVFIKQSLYSSVTITVFYARNISGVYSILHAYTTMPDFVGLGLQNRPVKTSC